MLVKFISKFHLRVVLLLPVLNAELSAETKGVSEYNTNFRYYSIEDTRNLMRYEESSDTKINASPRQNREPRQAPLFGQQKPQGYSSSFLNRLNTHGIALSGNIGIGVRYASGNNVQGGNPSQQHHQDSSSNIYDRYLGTNFNIGTNLHFANNEQGQTGNSHSQHQGGIGKLPKEEDSIKRLGIDNSTSRQNSLWNRLGHYFGRTKSPDLNATVINGDENESENCTEAAVSNNVVTKFLGKYFNKNEPRRISSENETVPEIHAYIQQGVLNDIDNNHNESSIFGRISKYFNKYKFSTIIEQIWNDRNNINPNHNESMTIKSDYESFRSTVREFLVDTISSYVSQNTTNENFFQKMIKKTLSQMVNESPSHDTKERHSNERITFMKYLSEYFTNEKIKSFFPDIETVKNNLGNLQWWEYEGGYATGWLKNNLPSFMNKYLNKGKLKNST